MNGWGTENKIRRNKYFDFSSSINRSEHIDREHQLDPYVSLENDIQRYTQHMENETPDFEESLRSLDDENENDFLEDGETTEALRRVHVELEPYVNHVYSNTGRISPGQWKNEMRIEYVIAKNTDIINTIYLELKKPDKLEGFSMIERFALLDVLVNLNVQGTNVNILDIKTALLQQIFSGNNIKESDTHIQIPLFDFRNTDADSPTGINGFPLICLPYANCMLVQIQYDKTCLIDPDMFGDLFVCGMMIPGEYRKSIYKSGHRFMFLEGRCCAKRCISNALCDISSFRGLAKFLAISFRPIDVEAFDYQEYIEKTPLLDAVEFSINGLSPMVFGSDDLLSIELFGVKVYLVPFADEFRSWESIREVFRNPEKNLTQICMELTNAEKITVELTTEADLSEYNTTIECMTINCFVLQQSGSGSFLCIKNISYKYSN